MSCTFTSFQAGAKSSVLARIDKNRGQQSASLAVFQMVTHT
jgi:hypothetical protein